MGYTAEVIADNSGTWAGNALVFATEKEAERYVFDLSLRWLAVRETRVVETEAEVNYAIEEVDDRTWKLVRLGGNEGGE